MAMRSWGTSRITRTSLHRFRSVRLSSAEGQRTIGRVGAGRLSPHGRQCATDTPIRRVRLKCRRVLTLACNGALVSVSLQVSRRRHLLRCHEINGERNIVTDEEVGAIEKTVPGDAVVLTVQRGFYQKPSAGQPFSVLDDTNHLNWHSDPSRYAVERQLAGHVVNVQSCRLADRRAPEVDFRKLRHVQNIGGAELLIEVGGAGVQ